LWPDGKEDHGKYVDGRLKEANGLEDGEASLSFAALPMCAERLPRRECVLTSADDRASAALTFACMRAWRRASEVRVGGGLRVAEGALAASMLAASTVWIGFEKARDSR